MGNYGAGAYRRAGDEASGAVVMRGFTSLQRALRRTEDGVQAELQAKLRGIGERVALVAAGNAPRGATGGLQHSVRTSVVLRGASVYSNIIYGGVQNVGAWTKYGRGPHVKRANASHYMDRAVQQLSPWVLQQTEEVMDWLMTTFEE